MTAILYQLNASSICIFVLSFGNFLSFNDVLGDILTFIMYVFKGIKGPLGYILSRFCSTDVVTKKGIDDD